MMIRIAYAAIQDEYKMKNGAMHNFRHTSLHCKLLHYYSDNDLLGPCHASCASHRPHTHTQVPRIVHTLTHTHTHTHTTHTTHTHTTPHTHTHSYRQL